MNDHGAIKTPIQGALGGALVKEENTEANVEKGPVTRRTLHGGDGYVCASEPRFPGRHSSSRGRG